MAAIYRAPIFKLLDSAMDIDWYYGYPIDNVKEMDPAALKSVTRLPRKKFGPFSWQKGVVKLIRSKDYNQYIFLGDLFSLSTWAFVLLRPILAPKKKVYFWSHGWYGRESWLKKNLKKCFFGLADGTFLYGNYAKQTALQQGYKGSNLWVVHNSLDYDKQLAIRQTIKPSSIYTVHFGNDAPVIVFIGRLTFAKRIDMLLEAISSLSHKSTYNVVLIGGGEAQESLVTKVKELNLEKQVWFYGPCYDEKENAELIYNASLCVSPGNVGLTAIHTMTFGTPMITHDSFPYQGPEFEAIVEGKTGSFFKQGDVENLACTIERWLKEHTDREAVREACFAEIDAGWNPKYQMDIFEKHLIVE